MSNITPSLFNIILPIIAGTFALLGVWLSNSLNEKQITRNLDFQKKKAKNDLLRKRGEELYQQIDDWLISYGSYYMSINMVMKGDMSYQDHIDTINKTKKNPNLNFSRISMIINAYFTNIKRKHDELFDTRSKLNAIQISHYKNYLQDFPNETDFLQPFLTTQVELEKIGEELKIQILKEIRSL